MSGRNKGGGTKRAAPKTCKVAGCSKQAKSGGLPGLCIKHGGGRRCSEEDCPRSAATTGADRTRCKTHGGGARCSEVGCLQSATGGGADRTKCKAHGGGVRCSVDKCPHGAAGSGAHPTKCGTHGGGDRVSVSAAVIVAMPPGQEKVEAMEQSLRRVERRPGTSRGATQLPSDKLLKALLAVSCQPLLPQASLEGVFLAFHKKTNKDISVLMGALAQFPTASSSFAELVAASLTADGRQVVASEKSVLIPALEANHLHPPPPAFAWPEDGKRPCTGGFAITAPLPYHLLLSACCLLLLATRLSRAPRESH
jgi:hypothetical protein